jgi:Co/Zn/Cd efflux system component
MALDARAAARGTGVLLVMALEVGSRPAGVRGHSEWPTLRGPVLFFRRLGSAGIGGRLRSSASSRATFKDMNAGAYELIDGDLHRHGARTHAHAHRGPHSHHGARDRAHPHDHGGHGHSHGLIDDSIKRSRAGVRAVLVSLAVLGVTAILQTLIFVLSGSVALLADLIHNFGDALTAVPLGTAFLLRSERAERNAGLFVVAAIFVSACVAGVEAVDRLIHPNPPDHLLALASAGVIGYLGNLIAARVRTRAGERLHSPALIADGHHARADALVSLAVVASAVVVAVGVPVADPIIGLVITLVILRITWQSWATIRGHEHRH